MSADGRVTNWTIVKTNLWYSDILELPFNKELVHVDNDELEILGMYEIDFIYKCAIHSKIKNFCISFFTEWKN